MDFDFTKALDNLKLFKLYFVAIKLQNSYNKVFILQSRFCKIESQL